MGNQRGTSQAIAKLNKPEKGRPNRLFLSKEGCDCIPHGLFLLSSEVIVSVGRTAVHLTWAQSDSLVMSVTHGCTQILHPSLPPVESGHFYRFLSLSVSLSLSPFFLLFNTYTHLCTHKNHTIHTASLPPSLSFAPYFSLLSHAGKRGTGESDGHDRLNTPSVFQAFLL